jgi:hypothetical protein
VHGRLYVFGVLLLRALHARLQPVPLGLQFLRFVVLLVLFVALFVEYRVVSYNTQFGRTSVLFQSAALFFVTPVAFVWRSTGVVAAGLSPLSRQPSCSLRR